MNIFKAIQQRHSVRCYTDRKIEGDVAAKLWGYVDKCNEKSGLNMQLCLDEPDAFDSFKAHYGSFSNVRNYLAIVGTKGDDLEEKCGYWGEKVLLFATQLGLSSCWVVLTYSKKKCVCCIKEGEKLCCVIALGYGETAGTAHKSKPIAMLAKANGQMPAWFEAGVQAAMLAPTAMNQQKFRFTLTTPTTVIAQAGKGFFTKIDLGIVKCHFEIGANSDFWKWG
ncbi:MAG: nitroreductase [Tannerellaceae bacterium]|jgi:hypothetical protein|nr:nitroreductase [Tannerellaceae bacterium]